MSLILKASNFLETNTDILRKKISKLTFKPVMRVILVGNNKPSQIYVEQKQKFCESVGTKCEIIKMPEDTDKESFLRAIKDINENDQVHGGIIQLPVSQNLKNLDLYNLIIPSKDIDGFHYSNIEKIYKNQSNLDCDLAPCTPKGILKLLDFYKIDLASKHVVVIGRSFIVGRPLSLMLSNKNATVTKCHSKTLNLKKICKSADIIISATGQGKFLTQDYFKNDHSQVFIDVGISRTSDNKLTGDFDSKAIESSAPLAFTPVPGGIGPMTVYSLVENLYIAAKNQSKR